MIDAAYRAAAVNGYTEEVIGLSYHKAAGGRKRPQGRVPGSPGGASGGFRNPLSVSFPSAIGAPMACARLPCTIPFEPRSQPRAADHATVLCSNALWYHVKRLYRLPHAEETKFHFNHLLFPFSSHMPDYRRLRLLTHYVRNKAKRGPLYLSFVNFSFWGEEGDVFGNLLAILFGLADDGPTRRILHALERSRIDAPHPVRAACSLIPDDHPLWRAHMGRHRQNLEYQYHNGGAWPFIGAFWVAAHYAPERRVF